MTAQNMEKKKRQGECLGQQCAPTWTIGSILIVVHIDVNFAQGIYFRYVQSILGYYISILTVFKNAIQR